MSWFRSNRGRVAWLALFALTCQLVLSFGHVHLGKARITSVPITASAAVAVGSGEDAVALSRAPPQAPKKSSFGFGDDFCAICASLNLASALVLPSVPSVWAPNSFYRPLTWTFAGLAPATFRRLFF